MVRIVAAAIVALAFGLRAYHLADANIWFDEGFSIWIAGAGPAVAASRTLHDTHPPLFYWLLWLWSTVAGDTAFALRFLSVAAGTLAVPLLYQLGRRLTGLSLGLVLALLLATSRFAIDWSQQIRMYAPALLLVALVLYLWWRLLANGRGANAGAATVQGRVGSVWRLWLPLGIAIALTGYTLYLALLVPTLLLLVSLWQVASGRVGRQSARGLGLAYGLAAVLLLPWLAAVLFVGSRPRLTSIEQPGLVAFFEGAVAAFGLGMTGDIGRIKLLALGLFAAALLGLLWAAAQRRCRPAAVAAALCLLVPPLLLFLLSRPNPILYLPNLFVRYLVVFLPAYLLGLAWLIVALGRTRLALGTIALLAVLLTTGWTLREYYNERYLTDDYQSLLSYVEAYARPGDRIVLYSDKDFPVFAAHYRDEMPVRQIGTEVPLTRESAASEGSAAFDGTPNVWVVRVDEGKDADPEGHFARWLSENARDLLHLQVQNRSANLYTIDPAERRVAVATFVPDQELAVELSPAWTLVGYDLPLRRVARGDALRVGLYLEAEAPVEEAPILEVDLVDEHGTPYRAVREPLVGDWFAPFEAGQIILGSYELRIWDDIPGGRYTLRVRLASPEAPVPTYHELAEVAVLSDQATPELVQPPVVVDQPAVEGVNLYGHEPLPQPVAGQPWTATLYWRVRHAQPAELQSYVRLIGIDAGPQPGNPVWAAHYQPEPGGRPTRTWVPGQVVTNPMTLQLPADLPAGAYRLEAGLYDPLTAEHLGQPVTLWEGSLGSR